MFFEGKCVGVIVYFPIIYLVAGLGYNPGLNNLDVLLLSNLVNKIREVAPYLRYDNLEADNKNSKTIVKIGFLLTVNQYEMMCKMKI